ncbi:MAG TPA: thioredoxin-disulfide reductase [Treponemataceae bacterium]|nr:thioredoxin-disulfide reductase [Treponemataceae bacterium]
MKKVDWDFIIIGAGTAGLAAAQYAARSFMRTLVIESDLCGGQALFIYQLENYPGLWPAVSGGTFIENMKNQATTFGATIEKMQVSSIDKKGDVFYVKSENKTITSHALLITTGATHRKLGVPGEDAFYSKGVSYCATCDGPFFRNKKIIVIGGGDSACDEANFLSNLSKDVTLIHRRDELRAQKAVADRVLKNPNIKVLFNTIVTEIKGEQVVQEIIIQDVLTKEKSSLAADGVFIFVGMDPQTQLINSLPKDEGGHIITDEYMQTAIKGMYCAGDIRSKPFRQLITAASDGAIAAHCAGKYIRDELGEMCC